MFPGLLVAIGIAVLVFGKRLAVLGAAVGALVGAALLGLLSASGDLWIQLAFVGLLAALGFFVAGFAKGIVDIVLLVIGALAGAAITVAFFDLFQVESSPLVWLLAVTGGVVGLILVRRFKDWAMIALAGLIGGLLVTRGLAVWVPFLQEGIWGTLLALVLAGGSIAYQGGFLARRKAAKKAAPATKATPATQAPAPAQAPAAAAQAPAATQTPAAPEGDAKLDTGNSTAPPPGD